MNLVPNWKRVLRRAWSVKFNLLASVLTGFAAALPVLMDKMPPVWFLLLCAVVPLAAAVARLVDQPKMRGDRG
jgi:hypothetical protein